MLISHGAIAQRHAAHSNTLTNDPALSARTFILNPNLAEAIQRLAARFASLDSGEQPIQSIDTAFETTGVGLISGAENDGTDACPPSPDTLLSPPP